MAQKHGSLANVPGKAIKCELCGESSWSWTDLNGEAYCTNCGSAHMLTGEGAGQWRVYDQYKPMFKEYWETTGKRNGSGSFMIGDDYEQEIKERDEFYKWVEEKYPDGYPNEKV